MEIIKNIKELLQEGVQNNHFPGASFAIVYQDGLVLEDFIGYKSMYPTKVKNKGDEIYDIASLTKVISTTTLVMRLIEENELSLNTKVSDIISDFKHKGIEIRHLLTHTSGLPADLREAYKLKN